MGFDRNGTKLLLYAKSLGVDFSKTLTLGRQGLHVDKKTLGYNLSRFGITDVSAEDLLKKEGKYAGPFLQLLGAKEIHSIDASDYEAATIIHDMNQPIDTIHKKQYDVVIDGGSLEHIFNFPVAIRNCMEMIKTGGHFLGISPANNFFGHGFYQFSPELYFRVFSPENGFKIEKIIFFIDNKNTDWYEIKDPNEVKTRVTMCNSHPSYLFIIAKKVADISVFNAVPQQSDYQNLLWKEKASANKTNAVSDNPSFSTKLFTLIQSKFTKLFTRYTILWKEKGDSNPDFFRKIEKE